jgi:ERF superfamily
VSEMKTSEQISELAAALAAAQGMMENAVMNRVNPHFKSKYADLAAIFDAARKPLSANGLAIVQTIGDGVLHTRLLHTSGQWIASEHPLPMSGRPQEIGSALTYARRYSLSALIGIAADEDDDGNATGKRNGTKAPDETTGELLSSEQMEFVWEAARKYCDPDLQQEWIDMLLTAIGYFRYALAEIPASEFDKLKEKITNWPKMPAAAKWKTE